MNVLKKWLSVFITVTMIFSTFPVTAYAEDIISIPSEAINQEEKNSEFSENVDDEEIISDTTNNSENEEIIDEENSSQDVEEEEKENSLQQDEENEKEESSQADDTIALEEDGSIEIIPEEQPSEFPTEEIVNDVLESIENEEDVIDDTVIYNLSNMEITVGTDEKKAIESPYLYKLFNENGEYTIELEDNAFFPYEVQFKYNGNTTVEWFETPESTVEIGGHIFRVHSEVTRDDMLSQFGVYVGGEYVPAYPKAKEFKNSFGISPMSLLPLDETNLTLDLTGYFPLLLDSVELSAIGGVDVKPQDKVFIRQKIDSKDDFRLLGDDEGLNISLIEKIMYNDGVVDNFIDVNRDAFSFELIVGSGKQLDLNNHRYEIYIDMTSLNDSIKYSLYEQLNTERKELEAGNDYNDFSILGNGHFYIAGQAKNSLLSSFRIESSYDVDKEYYLSLGFNDKVTEGVNIEFYEGYFKNAEDLDSSKNITDKIFNVQNMSNINAGFKIDKNESDDVTTMVLKDSNDKVTFIYPMTFSYFNENGGFPSMYPALIEVVDINNDYYDNFASNYSESSYNHGCEYIEVELYKEFPADSNYGLLLSDTLIDSEITKTVKGFFNSLSEAENEKDITDELFNYKAYEDNFSGNGVNFTVFCEDGSIGHINVRVYTGNRSIFDNIYASLKNPIKESTIEENVSYSATHSISDGCIYINMELYKEYVADAEYRLNLDFEYSSFLGDVIKVVKGKFNSLSEASNEKDIKTEILNNRYEDNFSGNGVDFTIFYENNKVLNINIKASEGNKYIYNNTGFKVWGIKGISTMKLSSDEDDYYYNGFQTIFVEDEDFDISNTILNFNKDSDINVYVEGSSELQESGISSQDFSEGKLFYSTTSKTHQNQRNFCISVVKKYVGGPKLFVNGINGHDGTKREMFLNSQYENKHDIFIANTGDETLTGLNVELIDAVNVKLDDYWTVGGENNDILSAFTEKSINENIYGYFDNGAKIRLLPVPEDEMVGNGEISGKLKISADGQEDVVIELSGVMGDPKIYTEEIPQAVKYVPYSAIIQTTNMNEDIDTEFELVEGKLPEGMTFTQAGEIYGVPKEFGTFKFKVKASFTTNSYYGNYGNTYEFPDSFAEFTLEILDNTSENVKNSIDEGYEIETSLPEEITNYSDYIFESKGELTEFMDFWLDGNKLERDVDYIAEEGSTKITISSQTFKNAGNGTHTIAAEFRVDGNKNNSLKRTAQNYTMNIGGGSSSGGSSSGGSSSGGSSSGGSSSGGSSNNNSNNTVTKPQEVPENTTPSEPVIPQEELNDNFRDVLKKSWYNSDVDWAYKQGIMYGVGNGIFEPNSISTRAMCIAVLARLSGEDLSQYKVENGQWYSTDVNWAKSKSIILDELFSSDLAYTREEIAIIIVRYFDALNIPYENEIQNIQFIDEYKMTEEGIKAFKILYNIGIFYGEGNNVMNPDGTVTRAQLAALAHRIAVFQNSL